MIRVKVPMRLEHEPVFVSAAGTPLTFDYNLHEYLMFGDGFVCEETGRVVRGFHHLEPEEKEALLPRVMPFVRTLHGRTLFGSESRC